MTHAPCTAVDPTTSNHASRRRIWIVTHFEPIPTEGNARPMRAGLLAKVLADRGHDVTWWTPDFDHYNKRHRNHRDTTVKISDGLRIRLLKSLGYRRHVGLRRMLNHELLARRWTRLAAREASPDLVVSGWPTPEFSDAVVRYGAKEDVPTVIDIRDLWPDLWLEILPARLRPLGRLVLGHHYRVARRTLRNATAIVGVTDDYVDWALRLADRARSPEDRAFAFRYRPPELDSEDRKKAALLLESHGYEPDDRLQFVFAGAFGRNYGLETVLDAGRVLDDVAPGRIRFVLCGSGDRWSDAERRSRNIDSVLVLPRLGVAELSYLYEGSHLGLAPYADIENFRNNLPNKIDEYLRAGLPIVTGVGGLIADLVDREGVGCHFAAGDHESLAGLAASLASDPSRVAALADRVTAYRNRTDSEDDLARYADHLEAMAKCPTAS